MREFISTITGKRQVTIPAQVRKHLEVNRGDKLSFVIDDDGTVKLDVLVYPTVASLHERGPGPDQNLSYNNMKEIAYQERLAGKRTREK